LLFAKIHRTDLLGRVSYAEIGLSPHNKNFTDLFKNHNQTRFFLRGSHHSTIKKPRIRVRVSLLTWSSCKKVMIYSPDFNRKAHISKKLQKIVRTSKNMWRSEDFCRLLKIFLSITFFVAQGCLCNQRRKFWIERICQDFIRLLSKSGSNLRIKILSGFFAI